MIAPNKDLPNPLQERFLKAFAMTGIVASAARAAKINRTSHYVWLKTDPEYAERFELANEEACDVVRTEIFRRAVKGVLEPVFQGGKLVGKVRKYSDRMLELHAKARMPEYRDKYDINANVKRVVVVEDEGWYGNDAHNLARAAIAEGAAAPGPNPN